MKRVVTMQDLSCLGKCSLTVAHPVLSAMGLSCSVLPTAVFSTHTGFPGPVIRSLQDFARPAMDQWQAIGARFDGILTGYLANEQQAALALELMERFSGPDTLVVHDPAMGDHGRRYSGIGPEVAQAHRQLCAKASLILPNATEVSLLTGLPYREQPDESWCREGARALAELGCGSVMLTGLQPQEGQVGFFFSDGNEDFVWAAPRVPRACHGTGDIFAAVVMGGLVQGMSAPEAGILAARFVRRAIEGTGADSRFGVAFEPELGWLSGAASRR